MRRCPRVPKPGAWFPRALTLGLFSGALFVSGALAVACSSNPAKAPEGPPPEYERPKVAAWDAAPQKDPLGSALDDEGEWEEDDEYDDPAPGGPSKPAPATDAGASSSDASASPGDAAATPAADSG